MTPAEIDIVMKFFESLDEAGVDTDANPLYRQLLDSVNGDPDELPRLTPRDVAESQNQNLLNQKLRPLILHIEKELAKWIPNEELQIPIPKKLQNIELMERVADMYNDEGWSTYAATEYISFE